MNVVVAFAVIIFLLRWITTGERRGSSPSDSPRHLRICMLGKDSSEQRSATDVLGFRPKKVTPDMVRNPFVFFLWVLQGTMTFFEFFFYDQQVNTISSMFPNIPP